MIDSLVSVRAIFFDKGTKFDCHEFDSDSDFASYGEIDNEESEEGYIKVFEEELDTLLELEEYYKTLDGEILEDKKVTNAEALKDFIMFDVTLVEFGDHGDSYSSGIGYQIDQAGVFDVFEGDIETLVRYAKEQRELCNDHRELMNDGTESDEVKFLVAMEYNGHVCPHTGEYDCDWGVIGRIEKEDIRKILRG